MIQAQARKKINRKIDEENIDRVEDEAIDLSQTFLNSDVGLNYPPIVQQLEMTMLLLIEPTMDISLSRRLLITE